MLNLLDKKEKKAVKREYQMRLTAVILFFISGSILIAGFLTVPSYSITYVSEKELSSQLKTLEQSSLLKKANDLDALLKDTNQKLTALNEDGGGINAHGLIRDIIDSTTSGVRITNFIYTDTSDTKGIQVSGVADTRDSLTSFSKALDSREVFTSVDVPVSNFASGSNINFTLRLSINGKK